MEALAVEKIHESADARLALDAADEDVDGRGRVLCLHVGSDELCAVGCADWVAGHAEEKRDDLVLTLERPQLRGEPPQAGGEMGGVGGAKHCKRACCFQSQSQISSHAASKCSKCCPRFRWCRKRCFRTMRDKGVGRLRKFTAFCIKNGISLACSLSLSHPSSKSQTPKAKRNLRHLRSHAFPLETHTERRED